MKRFKPLIITTLMITLLLSSYVAISAEYGSKDDPLVSLSYINDVLMPETIEEVDKIIADRTKVYIDELDKKMTQFADEFEVVSTNDQFIEKVSGEILKSQQTVEVLKLKAGENIEINSGAEFLVREGSATCTAGILNVTSGEMGNAKTSLNNLYLAVDDVQTITINQDSTVMVFGEYKKK